MICSNMNIEKGGICNQGFTPFPKRLPIIHIFYSNTFEFFVGKYHIVIGNIIIVLHIIFDELQYLSCCVIMRYLINPFCNTLIPDMQQNPEP